MATSKAAEAAPGSRGPSGLMLNSVAGDHVDQEDDEDGDNGGAPGDEKRAFLSKGIEDVGEIDDDILGMPFQGHSSGKRGAFKTSSCAR